jgi:hypothetical protein
MRRPRSARRFSDRLFKEARERLRLLREARPDPQRLEKARSARPTGRPAAPPRAIRSAPLIGSLGSGASARKRSAPARRAPSRPVRLVLFQHRKLFVHPVLAAVGRAAERRNVATRRPDDRNGVVDVTSPASASSELDESATGMKGRTAMPTFGVVARRLSCGGRGKMDCLALAALVLLEAQQPTAASMRDSQAFAGPLSWKSAQATPASPPDASAQTPPDADKDKEEKTSVPATVVDGEQLQSVLGIEALSSTGEDMGRIVDIIVDRTGQIRAAIIDFGGFLGVGSRKIAVDWRSLHFDPKKAGDVVVNLTKDQLRVAPIYKAAEPVVMIGGPGAKP